MKHHKKISWNKKGYQKVVHPLILIIWNDHRNEKILRDE